MLLSRHVGLVSIVDRQDDYDRRRCSAILFWIVSYPNIRSQSGTFDYSLSYHVTVLRSPRTNDPFCIPCRLWDNPRCRIILNTMT